MRSRSVLIGGVVGLLGLLVVGGVTACGGSGTSSSADFVLQRQADRYAIGEIERKFHEAFSKKDIDLMMSIWTPNATLVVGPGKTATGLAAIRRAWLASTPFQPETQWISDHPAYKLEVTVHGDRGTLYFECHFVDLKTGMVVRVTAGDADVARIGGRWLVTKLVGGTTELKS